MRKLEHDGLLVVIDGKWREHLYAMDYLKEGIRLRALAQRDPLVEFQREGYDMFVAMIEAVKEESIAALFQATVKTTAATPVAAAGPPVRLAESTTAATKDAEIAKAASGGESGRHAARH